MIINDLDIIYGQYRCFFCGHDFILSPAKQSILVKRKSRGTHIFGCLTKLKR
jgi:hypothetical protein